MRILCDQHVDHKYVHALQRADGITVTTVRHVMHADAPDSDIASYAAANDWLVLTSDDDFFTERRTHGLLFYQQLDDPTPSDVAAAVQAIDEAYDDTRKVVEKVPGGWI
jgi:predicted nuclease of predicted toxin-antitoxin system